MSSLRSPDPRKVEALQNVAPLINVAEVRSLLNCAVFCSRFIRPLREPICNGVKWQWTDEEQSSFGYFDPKKPTSIFVDSSPIGLESVPTQKDVSTNELTPLHCASCSLTPTEARYLQIDHEALSVYWAISASTCSSMGKNLK